MPALSIEDCLRFGWETFKKRPGILIGAIACAILIPVIANSLVNLLLVSFVSMPGPALEGIPGGPPTPLTTAQVVAMSIGFVISLVIGLLVSIGIITFFLRANDDIASVKIGDLWNPQPFWRFVGAYILLMIITFVGMLLLVVPGIIAALGLFFSLFLVIDRGASPIQALKESWRITKGNKWRLFLLYLVVLILNLLGALLLLVGLLVTVPVTWLALTHAYRKLASQAGA